MICKKKECCICYESKFNNTKCSICKKTIICSGCICKMMENGQISKCPVCRSEDWKAEKKNSIFPVLTNIKEQTVFVEDDSDDEDKNNFCDSCLLISWNLVLYFPRLIGFIFIFWSIGIFSIAVTTSYSDFIKLNYVLQIIIPIIIGFLEFFLCWLCCCSRHISFTQIILNIRN